MVEGVSKRTTMGACVALLLVSTAAALDETPAPAAEDAAAAVIAPATPQPEAVRQTYLRLMAEKRYTEAAQIAAQLVELDRQSHGERSPQYAASLSALARAQLALGNVAAAADNFRAAIALLERAEGPASPALIEPLVGLGDAYMSNGFYPPANDAYERALLLNHAAAGFYNLEQVQILDGLSESDLALGELADANARQRAQVAIQARRTGDTQQDLVQALYKLARWYNRTGQFEASRQTWQQARAVIRKSGNPADPAQVETMIGEALSYASEGDAPTSVSTLKRALEQLDALPEPDHARRAEVLVTLGDLYVTFGRPRSAHQAYEQAWAELSAEETLSARRDEYFDRPSRITGPRLPRIVDADGREQSVVRSDSAGYAPGYVVARMVVDADGSARDMAIVESEPAGLLDQQVLKALARTAFRPRLADGTATASEDVQFRHEFRYPRPASVAPTETGPDPAPAGDKGAPIGYPTEGDDHRGD